MSFKPLSGKVIVQRLQPKLETASGIILKRPEEVDRAKVIAVADDVTEVKLGDELLVNWNGLAKLDLDTYRIDINSVIAVFEKEK